MAGSNFKTLNLPHMGQDSAVGTATHYGLDGPGTKPRWRARFSAAVQTGPGAHRASYTIQSGQGVELTTHPHLEPGLKKE
jgi:hypothetical protein